MNPPDLSNLRTVRQLCEEFPQLFTEGRLRWWIFNAENNGFAPCLFRKGRRVFIDKAALTNWLNSQGEQPI